MAHRSPPTFSDPVELKCSHSAVYVLCEEYAHLGESLDKCREARSTCYKKLQTVIEEAYGHVCKKKTKDENLNDVLEDFQSEIETHVLDVREKHRHFEEEWKALHDQNLAGLEKFCLLHNIFWIPNEVLVSPSDFEEKVSIRLSNEGVQSFDHACVDRFQAMREEGRGVLCVPSVHTGPQRQKCRGKKKTLLRLASEEKTLECDAIYEVVDHLVRFGKCQGLNMLVLYNYVYGNYLKNIWKEVTKVTGDHDIMVICEEIGIILFQVKGCKGTLNRTLLQQAAVQLLKDKYVILESNRDVPFVNSELPVYSFIALPHNNAEQIDKYLCDAHTSLILNSSHLESDDSFSKWFLSNIPIPQSRLSYPFQGEDGLQYKLLCGRYVSNFSCVSLPTLCEGIKKAGQQIQLYCYNLTTSQAFLMKNQKPFVIITGDFGTGKSLLLALKAQHLAKNDGNCYVNLLTCSNASGFVSENLKSTYQSPVHIKKLIGKLSNLTVESFEIIPKSSKSEVGQHFIQELRHHLTERHNDGVHHLLLDEVPRWLFEQSRQVIRDITTNLPNGAVFWISLATQSYKVTPGDVKVVDQIKEFIPEFKNDIFYLSEVMRMPKNLFLLHKEIGSYIQEGHILDAVCGHSIPGPKPLVYTLPRLTLHNQNPLESEKSFEKVRVQKAFDQIFKKIGYPKDDSDVVILVFFFFTDTFINKLYTKLYHLLNAALMELHIKLRWKTLYTDSDEEKQGEDMFGKDTLLVKGERQGGVKGERQGGEEEEDRVRTVLVVDDDSFIGCQARVVICVDPFAMYHWFPDNEGLGWDTLSLTRCLSQHVHIAWPKEEASQLWQDHLEEWERDIGLRTPKVSRPELDYRLRYIAKGKCSTGECLDMLKEKKLIEEMEPRL